LKSNLRGNRWTGIVAIPAEFETFAFWAGTGWIAPWLKDVDPAYWREMIPCICKHWLHKPPGKLEAFLRTPQGQRKLREQLVTRISQAANTFVPWLEQAGPLRGKRILEIGCGSGSSTAGLAHAGARVSGVDIKESSLLMARKRLALLGFDATVTQMAPDWLAAEVDPDAFAGPYDYVVCYAMLEHLLIPERLNLLTLVKRIMARDGALLAVFETPNRFAPFDWHSSKLAFHEILPDRLAYEFLLHRSPKADHAIKAYPDYTEEAQVRLYRAGRGVSWHEFELTLGLNNIEVVLDGYSLRSAQKNYRGEPAFEAALAAVFAKLDPPVPRAFCRPSLELLLRLKG